MHFLHGLLNGVQALMVGRGMQSRLGHAADGRNVRANLGSGQKAAVTGLGALAYLDEHGAGIFLHVGHGADDAVPSEVTGGDLDDHVLELFAFKQAYGHTALARTHTDRNVALLVKIGHGQSQRFPRSGRKSANGHVGENQRVNPAHRRRVPAQDKAVPVNAERQGIDRQNAPKRSTHIEGMALAVQSGVSHLGYTAHDDGIQGAHSVHILAAAALYGPLAAGKERGAGVGVADGMDGLIGADLLAHAAAGAGTGSAVLLADDGSGHVLLYRSGASLAGYGAIPALDSHLNGVKGAGRHAGAAHRAFFRIVFDFPVKVIERNVLRAHCFHLRTSRSLSISISSRSFG